KYSLPSASAIHAPSACRTTIVASGLYCRIACHIYCSSFFNHSSELVRTPISSHSFLILILKLEIVKLFAIERSEEHTSELQSRFDLVCRLLLEKKNKYISKYFIY